MHNLKNVTDIWNDVGTCSKILLDFSLERNILVMEAEEESSCNGSNGFWILRLGFNF